MTKKYRIAFPPLDYCGLCPYLKNEVYYEHENDFQEDNTDKMKEIIWCGFFIIPIQLTQKEWENIPDWCPLDEVEE